MFDPNEMTVCFKMTGPMFEELAAQAKTLGVEPHEWAKKLVLSGMRSGLKSGHKPHDDWRFVFVVARQALTFETIEEAETHAAKAAEAIKGDVLIVPTDKSFLENALVARWHGVVIEEAKL